MPVAAPSASAQAVAAKYADIAAKHNDHLDDVEQLRQVSLRELVPTVLAELGMEDDADAKRHVRQYLKDKGLLFRFFRRSRYSNTGALDMLSATLLWRLRTDLDSLSLASLHPLYSSPSDRPPLFWCNTQCTDLYGRPLGVISLQSMERVTHDDGKARLDECREYIVGSMESVRRYLAVQYAQASASKRKSVRSGKHEDEDHDRPTAPPLQMAIIFSLQSSGMANLELELLPFLLDLLKNHFPGMVGAVYILHFGWVHSGMWALAKRILPEQALARIFFPSTKDMDEHFDLDRLPIALGGRMEVELVNETNDVMRKYARPHWNARLSRGGSRSDADALGRGEDEKGDAGDEAESVEEVEASSAPPSPRGLSGSSTPLLNASGAPSRTPRTLSRAGSFDSLIDEFHSLASSPLVSRSATPRTSRPTTPHAEMSAFHFTMAHPQDGEQETLRMTTSAAHKLHHLQLSRGAGGSRMRTMSDVRGGQTSAGASPVVSRGASPERRRRTATAGQPARGRNVHFDADEQGGGGEYIRRVGSLRDFRLDRDDLAQADDGIIGTTDSGSPTSSNAGFDSDDGSASDASGKTGERTDGVSVKNSGVGKQQGSRATRFFSLWRKAPTTSTGKGSQRTVEEGGQGKKDGEASAALPGTEDLTELEPEPTLPESPQLQVPDIEEPPLSEMTQLFSRRSRLYASLPGHVSPYNSANPFYGYPAYPATAANAGATAATSAPAIVAATPGANDPRRRYQFRRRKRDLVRTLMYLFVLRLLALHRHVRFALLAVYRGMVRAIAVGGQTHDEDVAHSTAGAAAQQRYQHLRRAGTRFDSRAASGRGPPGLGSRRESQESGSVQHVQRRPKPQPLVALGFRKRYAVLMIVIAFTLLRREWRSRRRV